MSNKDIGIIPSLNCLPNQPGQILDTDDQSTIGELMHIKDDPHLTLQPVGVA